MVIKKTLLRKNSMRRIEKSFTGETMGRHLFGPLSFTGETASLAWGHSPGLLFPLGLPVVDFQNGVLTKVGPQVNL